MKNIEEAIEKVEQKIFDADKYENFYIRHVKEGGCEMAYLVIYQHNVQIKILIYNSEDDNRKWIEEKNDYEDFEVFLLRQVEDALCSITEFKGILIN